MTTLGTTENASRRSSRDPSPIPHLNNAQMVTNEADPFSHPDLPIWRREYSYRHQPYRYLCHQQGIIGHLKVRVVGARELSRETGDRHGREMSPQVYVTFLDNEMKTSVVFHNNEPTWRKEEMVFEVPKGKLVEGAPVIVSVEVVDTAAAAVVSLMGKSASLGHAPIDITSMLKGEEGFAVMDTWVDLSAGGKLHVVLEYDPYGLTPEVDDVVFFEAFARHPRGLVLPIHEPLVVRDISGSYLLLSYWIQSTADADMLPNGKHLRFQGTVKVHRNTVFVVERKTIIDDIWDNAMKPADMVLNTAPGKWAVKQVKPYVNYAKVLTGPVLMSASVAMGAVRLAARSAMAGVSEVASTALGEQRQF